MIEAIERFETLTMAARTAAVIVNANVAGERYEEPVQSIRDPLKEMKSDAEVVETYNALDARRAINRAVEQGRGPIVICGGDGTVARAASILLETGSKVPLGIVPLGKANDYALHTLGLPRDPRVALDVALHGRPRAVNALRVNDQWATNIFAAGLAGNVAWDIDEMLVAGRQWASGPARHTISLLRQIVLHYNRLPLLDITIDGKPWGKRHMLTLAVTAAPAGGGAHNPAYIADPNDGHLNVVLIRRLSRLRAPGMLSSIRTGQHTALPEVEIHRARSIVIRSDKPVKAQMDGELMRHDTFDIRVAPAALTVMTPR